MFQPQEAISIHAPRTGSDESVPASALLRHFNPRSPHGERRGQTPEETVNTAFQSTLPARGATFQYLINQFCRCISIHAPRTGSDAAETWQYAHTRNFNPRSPHGERLVTRPTKCTRCISIHAPRTGSDANLQLVAAQHIISIHAPRTGSDGRISSERCVEHDFNPRSPHGERLQCWWFWLRSSDFNPRSPHGERLRGGFLRRCLVTISIHAPRTGSDARAGAGRLDRRISIHAPRTGSDSAASSILIRALEFQSTLPARGATMAILPFTVGAVFQSTLPARGAT